MPTILKNSNMDRRDINKIDKTILDNFYKLVHSQPNVRLTAASSTFKILNAFKKSRPDTFNENLNYSIDRLVAGLSSNRALARRGYATLLMELLKSYQVSTERLLTIANQKFGHISKDATRDGLIGYFLLIAIILNSENYKRNKSNTQQVEKMYKYLMQLVTTKSYFEYSVSSLLVEYRELFYPFMFADIPVYAFGSDAKLSPVELLSVVLCNKKEPLRGLAALDGADVISLCQVLTNERLQKRPLHPAFLEVGRYIMEFRIEQFEIFYAKVLFPTFFKANHNELAAMGLELTAALIESTNSDDAIKILLSDHLVRTLILALRNKNSLRPHCITFGTTLKQHFRTISGSVTDDNGPSIDAKQFSILQKLTSTPGSLLFDDDSKSSFIAELLNNSTSNVLRKYLNRIILALTKKTAKNQQVQSSLIKQITHIICRPQLVDDQATMQKTLRYLLINSLFELSKSKQDDPAELISQLVTIEGDETMKKSLKEAFRNSYHATLHHMVSASNAVQRQEQFSDLVSYGDELLKSKNLHLISDDASTVQDLWSKFLDSLGQHRKLIKKHKGPKQLFPITSLFYFYGLQVIEHSLDCQSQLEELHQSSTDALEGDPTDGSWADILTDQIIAILSATECKPWIRKLCVSIFGSLLPHISQTSIDILCEAIKTPLDEGDSEDEEDEGSDVEMAPEELSDDDGEHSEDDDDEDDDDAISDEDDAMSVGSSGEQDISQVALKSELAEKDEDDEEDEEYLDDEQMMKMDSVIADMFKLNRIGKKNKRKADPTFKLRCLDLVKKIILKKRNDTETIKKILDTIIPLAKSAKKSPDTRPISDKITKMLPKNAAQLRAQ